MSSSFTVHVPSDTAVKLALEGISSAVSGHLRGLMVWMLKQKVRLLWTLGVVRREGRVWGWD